MAMSRLRACAPKLTGSAARASGVGFSWSARGGWKSSGRAVTPQFARMNAFPGATRCRKRSTGRWISCLNSGTGSWMSLRSSRPPSAASAHGVLHCPAQALQPLSQPLQPSAASATPHSLCNTDISGPAAAPSRGRGSSQRQRAPRMHAGE